jgi:VanZ family protein
VAGSPDSRRLLADLAPALVVAAVILALVPVAGTLQPRIRAMLSAWSQPAATPAAEGAASLPEPEPGARQGDQQERLFVSIMLGCFIAAGVTFLVVALRCVRTNRLRRLALIALGFGAVAIQQLSNERGTPVEAAVERMHFVLFGLLAAVAVRGLRRRYHANSAVIVATLLLCGFVAVLDEGFQWLLVSRVGEIFDVGINLFAAGAGLVVALGMFGGAIGTNTLPTWAPAAAAPLVILLVWFIDTAHLGYLHRDRDIASFRSYYSPERLPEINRERARRWAQRPPRPGMFALEDAFATEAGWRIDARNQALVEGRLRVAERENRLLERYYSSFLDRGYRLPPWDLARLEQARKEQGARPYNSAVGSHRIWIRPARAELYAAASGALLVLGVWWLLRVVRHRR